MSKLLKIIAKYLQQGKKIPEIMKHIPEQQHAKVIKEIKKMQPSRAPTKIGNVEAQVRNPAEAMKLQEKLGQEAKGAIQMGKKVQPDQGKIIQRGMTPPPESKIIKAGPQPEVGLPSVKAPSNPLTTPEVPINRTKTGDWEEMLMELARKKGMLD